MANILDYLDWRGDVPLSAVPYNEADELVLCRLAYLPFERVLPEKFQLRGLSACEAVRRVHKLCGKSGDGRVLLQKDDTLLLEKLSASPRYSSIRLTGYVNRLDEQQEKQFSAVTALLPDHTVLVIYRGTDNTLVGWKEDFNMSFADEVPAQREAVNYLQRAAAKYRLVPLRVCGHSKGGNLAVYAAAFCDEKTQARIRCVRNNDGPGFLDAVLEAPGYRRIVGRTRTYLPHSSVFGMLLEHAEQYSVVQSSGGLLAQHDLYAWQVTKDGPVLLEELSEGSLFLDAALKDWLSTMEPARREDVVDTVFSVLDDAGIESPEDLLDGKKNMAILKTVLKRDDETRKVIFGALRILTGSVKRTFPLIKEQENARKRAVKEEKVHS